MAHVPFEPTIAGAQARHPYAATNVSAVGFPLPADAPTIQALLDKYLNIAPLAEDITFQPVLVAPNLLPNLCMVMMEILNYPALASTTPPWNGLGRVQQKELLFSIPVIMIRAGFVVETGIFIPYIFVDDQGSMLTGREVLGLPKLLATFEIPAGFPQSGPIVVRFQGRRAAGGQVQRQPRSRSQRHSLASFRLVSS